MLTSKGIFHFQSCFWRSRIEFWHEPVLPANQHVSWGPQPQWQVMPKDSSIRTCKKTSTQGIIFIVCPFSLQNHSPRFLHLKKKKKQEKTGGLLHQVFPKSTIHWTETLPQKPTKNPGGGHPQCYLDSPGFSSLAPFKSSWICCLLQYCTFIVPDTWNFLELM